MKLSLTARGKKQTSVKNKKKTNSPSRQKKKINFKIILNWYCYTECWVTYVLRSTTTQDSNQLKYLHHKLRRFFLVYLIAFIHKLYC